MTRTGAERDLFFAYGVTHWHCSSLVAEGALRHPCDEHARTVWRDADGVRIGYCRTHQLLGKQDAERKGWLLDERELENAA